jgi:hypothetical protein
MSTDVLNASRKKSGERGDASPRFAAVLSGEGA